MAEDLNRQATPGALPAPTVRTDDSIVTRPPSEWESAPHAGRFLIAYGLLGLVLGAAVIGLAVGLTRGHGSANTVPWSSWKPTASGTKGVDQIVQHVSTRYRLADGRQIVAVVPRSPSIMSPPITAAAVDKQALFPSEQQFNTYPMDNSLLFIFCGGGTKCAINEGTPSSERLRLLRREALELALYTFHYVPSVSSVVTFLPPSPAAGQQQQSTALFFRKDAYSEFVHEPLADTLPGTPAQLSTSADQQVRIDKLTFPALYRFQLQRSPDGSNSVILFSPVVPTS